MERLAEGVSGIIERKGLKARTVTVKIRLANFTTFTRQSTLALPTHDPEPIKETAWRMLAGELGPGRTFRLLGVGVSNFGKTAQQQLTLFDDLPV